MVGGYVDAALAERFQAWALQTDGGAGRLGRAAAAHPPGDGRSDAGRAEGGGTGHQVGVRFKDA